MRPASRHNTFKPWLARTWQAIPPAAPEPTTITSYSPSTGIFPQQHGLPRHIAVDRILLQSIQIPVLSVIGSMSRRVVSNQYYRVPILLVTGFRDGALEKERILRRFSLSS